MRKNTYNVRHVNNKAKQVRNMMDKVFKIGDKVELVDSNRTKLLEMAGFSLKGTICKINIHTSGTTCDIETEDTSYTDVPVNALKLITEEDFKSQQEIWEYLSVEGNKVVSKETGWQYLFIQGILCRVVDGVSDGAVNVQFTNVNHFAKYQEPVQTNWYDNIPPQRVLCWVSDSVKNPSSKTSNTTITIINRYDNKQYAPFIGNVAWVNATPVTQEELNNLIYQPTM